MKWWHINSWKVFRAFTSDSFFYNQEKKKKEKKKENQTGYAWNSLQLPMQMYESGSILYL